MAALTLKTSRSLAAGQLARKLISLARRPTNPPLRCFASVRFSVSDGERYSSDEDSDGDVVEPAVFHPIHGRMVSALVKNIPKPCGGRGSFDVWEDMDDGFQVRLDMPGLDKENVKIWVERKALHIRGEGEEWNRECVRGDIALGRNYATKIVLPNREFNLSEIKAEVKNGVLRVSIPSAEKRELPVHVEVA